MTKESALGDIYNLVPPNGSSKPLFVQRPTDKKAPDAPICFTPDQQVLILALLRSRVCTAEHFKTIFGEKKFNQNQPA